MSGAGAGQIRRIGIDVGGTFNDFVLADGPGGRFVYYKEPSTPDDPSLAVERGISGLLAQAECSAASIGLIAHGTTLGLNTILQRRGARLALVVSRGNRDVFEIARSRLPAAYDFTGGRETPLVPRDLVFEIDARIRADGEILAEPAAADYVALASMLAAAGVDAAAIMLVNAYRHPALERRVAEALRRHAPAIAMTESAAIWPEIREYERALLAGLNAYVQPQMEVYFERLTRRLAALGLNAPLYVTTNNGGSMSLATARRRPIDTLLSGPAAGVGAALRTAPTAARRRLITLDMGGTSTDIAVLYDGRPELTMAAKVGDYPLMLPVVGVTAIGAGGGSKVWLDNQGVLKVGPDSAGASPGPACYGLGGQSATITDCYLETGMLDPDNFLGGRLKLSRGPATEALARLAAGLGGETDSVGAAAAVLRVATTMMSVQVSKMLARRGYDHREFSLLAFGGAGATHANMLAQEANLAGVVIPPAPGTFCALGAALADLRRDFARSVNRTIGAPVEDFAPILAALTAMEAEAFDWIRGEGHLVGEPRLSVAAEMRYPGQAYELSVHVPDAERATLDGGQLAALFHDEHERLYGFAERGLAVRVNTLRVSIAAPTPTIDLPRRDPGGQASPNGRRNIFLADRWIEAALYDRRDLPVGSTIVGPSVVAQPDTTVLVLPDWAGVTDAAGNLLLSRR